MTRYLASMPTADEASAAFERLVVERGMDAIGDHESDVAVVRTAIYRLGLLQGSCTCRVKPRHVEGCPSHDASRK